MKLRKHHNNKGLRHIKTGKTRRDVKAIARKLAIPKPVKVNWEKEHWDVFSLWIRREGVCLFHKRLEERGIESPCGCTDVLQACHKLPRRNSLVFWDERNVFCGCGGSNAWAHFHEKEWDKLWRLLWPEDVPYLDLMEGKKGKYDSWFHRLEIDRLKKQLAELSTTSNALFDSRPQME